MLVTYPLNTTATSPGFLQRKYRQIKTITLVDFNLTDIENEDFETVFESLPIGFIKSPYFGIGLNYDLRNIVHAVEEIRNITDIRIVQSLDENGPALSGNSYVIDEGQFDEAWRAIRRIHDKALELASEDKDIFANNALLTYY